MESCGHAMDLAVESANLVLNNAIEVADLLSAGGPESFMAATESCLRTSNRLVALERGARVLSVRRPQAPSEVYIVVDGVRRGARPVSAPTSQRSAQLPEV